LDSMSLLVRTCSTERMNASRLIARIFIVAGGLVWAMMFFAQATTQRYSNLTYTFHDVTKAGVSALLPLALTVAVFVMCLYYERLAAVVLFAAAGVVVVWGLIVGLGPLLWMSVLLALVVPMAISASLLLLAASTQRVCELEGKLEPGA
jgi:hypothetical protein